MTSHRDAKSYGKYRKEDYDLSSRACNVLCVAKILESFSEVYAEEVNRRSEMKVGSELYIF